MTGHHDERMFRFCPHCGGPFAARILKAGDPARLVCDACGFVFYLDPKVAVGTIIRTNDHEIVLCRRAIAPGYGRWVFPGGYVDRGEKLEEAAVREAREECGLEVGIERLVSLHSYRGRAPVVIVYEARAVGGVLTVADEESLEVRTFTAENIPWGDLAFDSTAEALRAYFNTQDSGLRTQNSELRTQDSGLRTQDSELRTQNSGLRTQNSELRTQNSELRTQDSGSGAGRKALDARR